MWPEDDHGEVVDTGTSRGGDVAVHLRPSTGEWLLVDHRNVREHAVLSSGRLSTELVKLVAELTSDSEVYVRVSRDAKLMSQFVSFREACSITTHKAVQLCKTCWTRQKPSVEAAVTEIILE